MVLINQKDCVTVRKNLGLSDCIIQEGRLTGKILVPKGWNINLATDTFNLEYVNEQIQLGNFIPILGAVEVTNTTPEATTEEFQGGIKNVVRNGLPEFNFKFIRSWYFSNALHSYNSNGAYDIILVFVSGAIAGATNGTTFSGFDLGMLNAGTYMFTDGSTSTSVTTTIQLKNEIQFNQNVAVLDSSVLDFNVNADVFPITDIIITGSADVSADKVYFKPVFQSNQSSILGGITIANLRVTIDGVASTIVALSLTYDALNSRYEFEPTDAFTTSSSIVVQLYDSVNAVAVAKIGARYYKGASAEITPQQEPIMTSANTWAIGGGVISTFQVEATNNPNLFEITVGTLPAGITLNSATGLFTADDTGDDIVSGTYPITLKISNTYGFSSNAFTVEVE